MPYSGSCCSTSKVVIVLISRLPRCSAGTSVPWRNSELAPCTDTAIWPGSAFSMFSLNINIDLCSQSLSAAACEMRICRACDQAAGAHGQADGQQR
jgi:hypothetical protein